MVGGRPKRNTSSTLHLPYRNDRRSRHYDDETTTKSKRKAKYDDDREEDDDEDHLEYEYDHDEREEDNGVTGTDVAFGVGGVLVEVFDLFLTCMGSEDLRDDKEILGFIGMNSIRAQRTCLKEMDGMAMPPGMDVDVDESPSSAPTSKTDQEKMKTAKLKKWIEKKKAYMKRQHQQQAAQQAAKEKVWNILEESIHRRTTVTPSSLTSKSTSQRLSYPYPLPTSGAKQATASKNDTNERTTTKMYSIREEETTTTRNETAAAAEGDDVNHRDDIDTTEYGTTTRTTTSRTGPATGDDDRDDDDDDERCEAETDRTTTTERRQQSEERRSSKQPIIDTPELVKPSTITKKDDKKKWLSSVHFPVGRFASFNAEKSNRKKQTTTDNHLYEPTISTTRPKSSKVVFSESTKVVVNGGRKSPSSHLDEPTMSSRPESSKVVVSGGRKSPDANGVRMERLSTTQEAREIYQRRLDLLARAAAVRAAAAASRCDE